VVRESLLSFGPLAVRAFIYWLVELAHQRNWGMLYEGDVVVFTQSFPAQAAAIGASVLLLDFLHDAWFFFMHLLMHRNRWLLVHVHYLHHDSKVPTPFSGYSLHVLEAMLVFPIDLMVCFLIPIHVKVHRLYHLFTIFLHVGGHATYELHPLVPSLGQLLWIFFQGDRVSDELNTVLYHNLHHQFPNCHFSLYFTHWDRLFNTLKKDYRARVDKMKEIQKGQIERETTYLKYYLVLLMCMTCAVALSCLAYTLIYNAARLACNLLANVR
jgi:sterol desaturase/sphingolipid hydroxylase (fatty acid hydroxylase superfamily)